MFAPPPQSLLNPFPARALAVVGALGLALTLALGALAADPAEAPATPAAAPDPHPNLRRLSRTGALAADPAEAPATPAATPDPHPELRRLSKTDEIWLDIPGKRVIVGGKVALSDGLLEVFACPVLSKEHEAVVATNCPAKLVHAGLLAIGLEPGKAATYVPAYVPAQGSKVRVMVRWTDKEGKVQERPGREWVRNTKTGKELDVDWVFTGSGFWRDPTDGTEHYEADAGDMICLSNFPGAMLDVPMASSDTNDDLMFEVFEGRVPPHGTAVELILSSGE